MKKIGLRIDVDTLRGTRQGVPNLLKLLSKHQIRGTFYFSMGPDNMGRHLWRLLKPTFLWKMLRTNAAGLYGPEIILMGTMWPGPKIGKRNKDAIRAAFAAGHEMGFHAWDHHREQSKIEKMSARQVHRALEAGCKLLEDICGEPPTTSAVPGWRCTDTVLLEKAKFPFEFNSDCRGKSLFYPEVNGKQLKQAQVPVTLPTYDEVVGRDGITDENYNDHMLSLLKQGKLNVLTIHAEAEGGKCLHMFDEFIRRAKKKDWEFCPLGKLLKGAKVPAGKIVQAPFPGREGWLAVQEN